MKSFHVLFIGLGLIGIIILYVIWNIGLMKPVQIQQVDVPEMRVMFKKYQGPYQNAGPIFNEVEASLAEVKIPCDQTFGRYYDNPNETEPERTRADIGCIIKNQELPAAPNNLETETIAGFKALEGSFEGAPWLTAFKVYKTLRKESYQRNIMLDESQPVLEIYEKIDNGFKTKVYFRLKSAN